MQRLNKNKITPEKSTAVQIQTRVSRTASHQLRSRKLKSGGMKLSET